MGQDGVRQLTLERDGVRLTGLDFGGVGPPVLLLHGLCGHAGEWSETASWLTGCCRVVAFSARGHGGSERRPSDVSLAAHVADAAHVFSELRLGPALIVGQSLGGQTAMLLAAEHPELVRALVVVEGTPDGDTDAAEREADLAALRQSLERWPARFDSREEAVRFFGGPSLRADAWADGLRRDPTGCTAQFDIDVMIATLRAAASKPYWTQWQQIACPTLVVRAANGYAEPASVERMVAAGRHVLSAEILDAGHDVHLDQPREWQRTLQDFIESLA